MYLIESQICITAILDVYASTCDENQVFYYLVTCNQDQDYRQMRGGGHCSKDIVHASRPLLDMTGMA